MAEDWFWEPEYPGFEQRYVVERRLWSGRSPLQEIEVIETRPFGRALVLDGALQTTQADEFCYHEMLVHPALCAHPAPRRVLVIGGGDGGALRHVLMHPVERAVHVEIDDLVVQTCRSWLPDISDGAFDDPRTEQLIGDGMAFLHDTAEAFDVILVDSTDPVGPAEGLISAEFFEIAATRLAPNGLFAIQSGSPLLMRRELAAISTRMRNVFPRVSTYLGHVPSYPGVLWSFTVGSFESDASEPRRDPPPGLRFYNHAVHRAAFQLPAYVRAAIDVGPESAPAIAGPILG
jgi:spermidine synthase